MKQRAWAVTGFFFNDEKFPSKQVSIRMSAESTENDAEIARILSEEYESVETNLFNSNALKRGKSCSPIPSKRSKIDHVEQKPSSQFDEDSEMAYILQIEEIVLSENQINDKTTT